MRKIKYFLRSFLCILLAVLSLCLPVGYGYLGASCAYGMDGAIGINSALEFLQMILASAGVTFQSTADLTSFGNAFDSYLTDDYYADFAKEAGMTEEQYKEQLKEWNILRDNEQSVVDFTSDKVKGLVSTVKSFFGRLFTKDSTGNSTASGITFCSMDVCASMLTEKILVRGINSGLESWFYNTHLKVLTTNNYLYFYGVSGYSTDGIRVNSIIFRKDKSSSWYLERCFDSSNQECVRMCSTSTGKPIDSSTFDNSCYRTQFYSSSSKVPYQTTSAPILTGYIPLSDYKVYANCPVYSSFAEFKLMQDISAKYELSKPAVVTGKTFDLPDSKILTGDLSLTKNVEEALTNTDIATSDDINSAVSELVGSYAEEVGKVTDSVDAQTSVLAGWLSKIYDKICKIEADTGTGITVDLGDLDDAYEEKQTDPGDSDDKKPYIWVPGAIGVAAFLKPVLEYFGEPLSDITKYLDKIVGCITDLPSKCADAIADYIPSLDTLEAGVKSIQKTLSGTLTVAIDGITDLPKEIGDAVADAIPGTIAIDGITDLPQDIADAVAGAIVIPGSIAIDGIADLPKDIADSVAGAISGALDIPDSIALDIPDVIPIEFPDTMTIDTILDLPKVLDNTLAGVFAIDDAAVDAAVDSLAAEWSSKFPYNQLAAVFAPLTFSDVYSYPVLKVQRPKILEKIDIAPEHLTSEDGTVYIILCNTADYAQYFKYIRNIVRAMIWVGFAYHLLRGFKVYFHIA